MNKSLHSDLHNMVLSEQSVSRDFYILPECEPGDIKCRYVRHLIFTITLVITSLFSFSCKAGGLKFRGNLLKVLEESPEKSTGLDKIYICYDTADVDFIYTSPAPHSVKIYKYSNLGGGFAEEIRNVEYGDSEVIVNGIEGNMGYIIDSGDKKEYYWIVDYLPYRLSLTSVIYSDEQDCDATLLNIEGSGGPIHYFTINGQQKTLSREIKIKYATQVRSKDSTGFVEEMETKIFESLNATMRIVPPVYCATSYTVEGDRFLEKWNWKESVESSVYNPHAVAIFTEVSQGNSTVGSRSSGDDFSDEGDSENSSDNNDESSENKEDASNIITTGTEDRLGGSAPVDISFTSYSTQGVLHHEWQMAKDPEFKEVEYRFNVQDLDYTFTEEGSFYLRYIGSNSDGSCEAISDTYTVKIGGSELLCPNAFSPDGDGVNDKWKVAYRSLLDFECWIFDRFGAEIYHFKDPSDGWDGTRNGKPVKSGVFYYVIQATGADGKKYKKSGDINILRHKSLAVQPSEE